MCKLCLREVSSKRQHALIDGEPAFIRAFDSREFLSDDLVVLRLCSQTCYAWTFLGQFSTEGLVSFKNLWLFVDILNTEAQLGMA